MTSARFICWLGGGHEFVRKSLFNIDEGFECVHCKEVPTGDFARSPKDVRGLDE